MTLDTYTYCTEAEIVRRFGTEAVVNWCDHDGDQLADTGVLDDAINQATAEINDYAAKWYDPADLGACRQVNRWCVTLAEYFAALNRGNLPPEILQREFDRIKQKLEDVAAMRLQLEGIAWRSDLRPSLSNLHVDRRHVRQKVRVDRVDSTDAPSAIQQHYSHDHPSFYP